MKHIRYSTRMMLILMSLVILSMGLTGIISLTILRKINMKISTTVLVKASKMARMIDPENLAEFKAVAFNESDIRITIINNDGTVTFDSHHDPVSMENHASRPEIAAALSGLEYTSIRFSETLQTYMLYYALPVKNVVVRLALPISEISGVLQPYMSTSIILFLLIIIITSIVLYLFNTGLIKPINALITASKAWQSGDLSYRIHLKSSDDFNESISSLNAMSEKLATTVQALQKEKKELSAILENINEAILVADKTLTIALANPAACKLFNQPVHNAPKNLLDFTTCLEINKLAFDCMENQQPLEQEITIYGIINLKLLVRCSPLSAVNSGIILAITDITKIRHLEDMRKDFVANVSHELRTPITLIKGYSEALLEDNHVRDENIQAKIAIIHRHADRMNAIIEDLLTLSKLESSQERTISMETLQLAALIDDALKSLDNAVNIPVSCPPELSITCNPELLEQAIINLADNAIKYTTGAIVIKAYQEHTYIVIDVIDEGPGIPEEHSSRIFERFYRIDRARSRETGGTGLGLSIVKHIAEIHKGTVSVRNNIGKGATFSLCIPKDSSQAG